jgi:hypothetical protein
MVEPFADGRTARPGLRPCGCPPHRRAPRTHRGRHSRRGRRTHGHRRWIPDVHTGHWTADAWTSHARTLDGHTGHRTADAWTRPRSGQDDLGTAGIRIDILDTTTTRLPAGTPNRGPVDGACGARQRSRLGDGEVPASARLPTAYRTPRRLLGRSVGQAAPWRTAVLRRLRVERRASGEASSVMTSKGARWVCLILRVVVRGCRRGTETAVVEVDPRGWRSWPSTRSRKAGRTGVRLPSACRSPRCWAPKSSRRWATTSPRWRCHGSSW